MPAIERRKSPREEASYIASFIRWLQLKIYQYEVTFSLYMLTPREKFIFSEPPIFILYLPRHLLTRPDRFCNIRPLLNAADSSLPLPPEPHCHHLQSDLVLCAWRDRAYNGQRGSGSGAEDIKCDCRDNGYGDRDDYESCGAYERPFHKETGRAVAFISCAQIRRLRGQCCYDRWQSQVWYPIAVLAFLHSAENELIRSGCI